MTHSLHYGKTQTFQADLIDFGSTPLVLPSKDGVDPMTVSHASYLAMIFTNAPGSARTDAGIALQVRFTRLNNIVQMLVIPDNLRTSANAVAGALLTFNQLVPTHYWPATVQHKGFNIQDNNVLTHGAMGIGTATGILEMGVANSSGAQVALTNGQPCMIGECFTYTYEAMPL
jgi:hypothetical protein